MTEAIHLDVIINQVSWISALFKKCGAQIEVQGKYYNNALKYSIAYTTIILLSNYNPNTILGCVNYTFLQLQYRY